MQPLPQSPPPDWRRYILLTVIWVAFIAALGYAASNGSLGFLENAVTATAEPNRDRVTLKSGEPAVIQVKVSLRNNTRNQVTLTAPTACKVFRWQIFDRAGDMVQSVIPKDTCPQSPVTAYLPAGEASEEFYAIVLEAQRYRAGDDYLVHYWYWGYEGEFQFKAE
jgi:hypothetical protein